MIKKLTAMAHRTPILAIILAPVAVYLLVLLWNHALVPLYWSVWYGDTVLQWRLDSEEPAIRIAAVKDVGSARAEDTALLDELVARMQTDESPEVRKVAATSLGQLGWNRPLTAEAIQALGNVVLTTQDDNLLAAAIGAVGQSAPESRYPDQVVERIAGIFGEHHSAGLYLAATTVLGQVGAAQKLPDSVFAVMNTLFTDPVRAGERENLANAFTEISKGQVLPTTTLDILADAFEPEPNRRIRNAILYALAYSAADYPPSITVVTAATSDPDQDVASVAESGLRIIEYKQTFADKDPLSLAMDTSEPVEARLRALQTIRGSGIDPAAYEQIASLAQNPETEIAVAALGMFRWLGGAPDDNFDQRVLIPALTRAMSNPDPLIRYAAYGALSTMSLHRPAYLHADDFPAQLEAGANDPDPKVRVVVLVAMLRDAGWTEQRDVIVERGMTDPDPYVRRHAVSWLASPKTNSSQRQAFIEEALNDMDPGVRRSAATAQQDWESRERAWPIDLWRLWQAGERGKVGMRILIAVTVAPPILICGIFLLYFMARLLTYLYQRRWRAAAVVPVMATWAAASYGMFMLYFMAAHASNPDAGETAILAGILWGAIAVYTALGWGMHYAVRH